jgi:streptogramin lyase
MRLWAAALLGVVALGGVSVAGGAQRGSIPGADSIRACAAAGAYWPTMALAVSGATAWIGCKEQNRIDVLRLPTGTRTAVVRLDGPVTAVAAGLGALWALDSSSTLYRIDPRRRLVVRRIPLGAAAAYNIWIGGGTVWVADDRAGLVLRVSPAANRVVARIPVGDGPADVVFAGRRAWVATHRDNTLYRIDTRTNRAEKLAVLDRDQDAAVERLALSGGRLWATGRGVGLLEVDPETGAVIRTVDIGGTGIDIVAASGALWIPVRSHEVDRTGFPTVTSLRRIDRAGAVRVVATTDGRVDVHGLVAAGGSIWVADTTQGRLWRLPAT